jgi:hypothetical protein
LHGSPTKSGRRAEPQLRVAAGGLLARALIAVMER